MKIIVGPYRVEVLVLVCGSRVSVLGFGLLFNLLGSLGQDTLGSDSASASDSDSDLVSDSVLLGFRIWF